MSIKVIKFNLLLNIVLINKITNTFLDKRKS